MVHLVRISHGQATLCSRYVKTNKSLIEDQLKSFIVPNVIGGMLEIGPFLARGALFLARVVSGHYDATKGIGVANTNLAFLGNRLYALCESDLPYEIKTRDDGDIITLGHDDFDGKLVMNMTAHPKIDPETKEAFSFRYWATHPYLAYFRFDANGNKQSDVPIFSMNTPYLTHDLAITKKHAIICDIQLGADPMNMIRGGRLVDVDPTKIPRIGVLPRYAEDESGMKWFEVPGFNIFHAVNAWDETDEDGNDVVVLVAPNIKSVEQFLEQTDQIHPSMEKVKVNVGTGVVSRETLSSDNLEFPVINPAYVAKRNKYVYAAFFEKRAIKSKIMTATWVVKLDIEEPEENAGPRDHTVGHRVYGNNCYGGEPFFIAREP
ncbi:hypothetical protein LXL04_015258 [Taraxacum kok-saghyz]